ncbi:hypothetical protein OZ668_03670, partial [Elizabethkingia sp. HX XZB]|uniref:hypothetical protein n=1 Tax=Elizabethkingia sp. HX XZB TaxID=3003193 RepID=UPI002A23AD99
PPAPMVLLTRESRSPPVFIFEKPLHIHAEAFSFLGYAFPNLFLNQPIQLIGYTGYKSYISYIGYKSYGCDKVILLIITHNIRLR